MLCTFDNLNDTIIMSTTRQNKISRLLQKELSEIFQRNSSSLFTGKMITVTSVRVSPDLSVARVYLSIFPVQDKTDYLTYISSVESQIRFELGKRVRHQLRKIPELAFFLDDSLDYIENIDNLLK